MKKEKALQEYSDYLDGLLRNIKLNIGDIENDILTPQFFKRTDIKNSKRTILLRLTERVKKELGLL